jgi:hypothetical protein
MLKSLDEFINYCVGKKHKKEDDLLCSSCLSKCSRVPTCVNSMRCRKKFCRKTNQLFKAKAFKSSKISYESIVKIIFNIFFITPTKFIAQMYGFNIKTITSLIKKVKSIFNDINADIFGNIGGKNVIV